MVRSSPVVGTYKTSQIFVFIIRARKQNSTTTSPRRCRQDANWRTSVRWK